MKMILAGFVVFLFSCENAPAKEKKTTLAPAPKESTAVIADAATILAKKEVPILCYHDIREHKPGASSGVKDLTVQPGAFREQMKMLHDSGYQTITLDQYYSYLTKGTTLPSKPIIISFDDTDEEQYTIGAKEMEKYGFRGVYFIMTISIGRPRYMSKEQIKELSDSGHTIAAHTWDHHKVTEYTEEDWDKQITQSTKKLQAITEKPIEYFAYPFGIWKPEVIPELKERGIKAAFQLSAKRDSLQPLHSIRRMIVSGTWDIKRMQQWMRINFK